MDHAIEFSPFQLGVIGIKGCAKHFNKKGWFKILPFTLYPVPVTLYPLSSTLYPLPVTLYLLPVTRYPLPFILYPLPFTRYPLPFTRYPLPFTLYPLPFTLYPLPFTLYPLSSTLYSLPFTLYPLPFILYPLPFTLYPLPFILYPLPFTLCLLPLEKHCRERNIGADFTRESKPRRTPFFFILAAAYLGREIYSSVVRASSRERLLRMRLFRRCSTDFLFVPDYSPEKKWRARTTNDPKTRHQNKPYTTFRVVLCKPHSCKWPSSRLM